MQQTNKQKTNATIINVPPTSLFFFPVHAFYPKEEIRRRYGQFEDILKAMEEQEGGIKNFALGHKTFGPQVDNSYWTYLLAKRETKLWYFSFFQIAKDGTITWLEWAPAAQ